MATNYPPQPPGQAPVPPGVPPDAIQPGAPAYDGVAPDGTQPEGGPVEESKSGGSKTPLIIGGMVLALIVIGAAVFLLLGGGGDSPSTTAGGTAAPRPTGSATGTQGKPGGTGAPSQGGSTASPAPSLDPGLSADVSESYQQYSARNPFKCTFGCQSSGGSSTTTGGTTTGGTSASPSPQGGSTSGTQQASSSSLTLSEIVRDGSTQKAIVKVNGTTYTVGAGESFASNYKVTKISGSCASFLQGDSPFTLCTGQSVLK